MTKNVLESKDFYLRVMVLAIYHPSCDDRFARGGNHHETIAKGNNIIAKIANATKTIAKIANATNAIAKIADNDNEYDNDINIKETSPKGEAKKKVSLTLSRPIDIRKKEFYESILPYTDRYERDMLNDFYQYWTEMDRRRQRMRFEMQKTWETGKRLAVWARKPFQVDKGQGDEWTRDE